MMTNVLILAAAAAASPAPPAATAAAVVVTARRRAPRWEAGEAAERYRLRELPKEPEAGRKRLNPILRIAF